MQIFDGLIPYFLLGKMREGMDRSVFVPRQSWTFSFIIKMIKKLFPICTLTWLVNNYLSRQREV